MTHIEWVESLPGHATYRWLNRFVVQINRPKWMAMPEAMRRWYGQDLLDVKYGERS